MAVPRKRKKIAPQEAKTSSPQKEPASRPEPSRPRTAATKSFAKLDSDFHIMDSLDQRLTSGEKSKAAPPPPFKRSGLRVNFSFEAVMPGKIEYPGSGAPQNGKVSLLHLDFTFPFIWELPVIGAAAQKALFAIRGTSRTTGITSILGAVRPPWLKRLL